MNLKSSRPGAMLLITVLLVGGVALLISLSLALRGISELDMGFAENQSLETLAITDGCLQEALIRLAISSSYTGDTLSLGDGTCTITVTSDGTKRTVSTSSTIDRWTRTMVVRVDLSTNPMILLEWEQGSG